MEDQVKINRREWNNLNSYLAAVLNKSEQIRQQIESGDLLQPKIRCKSYGLYYFNGEYHIV